ncbi:heme oxygenase [Komagataeibacter diospyri]|uniref:biliverdin-producing heme oxygenase n=1 Tax=Komagataeibacter diospyri TaxID=1932662 RepID=UPI001137718E|nr:biliverdin-producing heme oxygenase [Komagataeibacter diospyri]GCE88495.1 heme oxygenase [Komagataeibacter diospyri]
MTSLSDRNIHVPLSGYLREATQQEHDAVNHAVMSGGMFTDATGYRAFVLLQYLFHRDISPLYDNQDLAHIVPDLAARNRFRQISADMADLGVALPASGAPPGITDPSNAIGWLYVAEGSKLGANFLIKLAGKMGFNENSGARHLAPDPMGRGPSWAAFRKAMDNAQLDPERCVQGARDSYARVKSYIPVLKHPAGTVPSDPAHHGTHAHHTDASGGSGRTVKWY